MKGTSVIPPVHLTATYKFETSDDLIDVVQNRSGYIYSRWDNPSVVEVEKSIVEGVSLSDQSGEMLQKIVDGAQQAVSEMERISNATNEQVHGSGLIRASMNNVSDMIHQIVTAIDEQGKGSHIISTAAERVRDLVGQINTSIHEQSSASRSVASGMQDVNDMIKKVFTACEEQMTESKQITTAVDSIKTSAQQSLNSTSIVNGAVGSLEEQVAQLQTAVGRFRFSEGIKSSDSEV